jgi:hypothetical protein
MANKYPQWAVTARHKFHSDCMTERVGNAAVETSFGYSRKGSGDGG